VSDSDAVSLQLLQLTHDKIQIETVKMSGSSLRKSQTRLSAFFQSFQMSSAAQRERARSKLRFSGAWLG
jgi:hypothetical protein